MLDKNFTSQTKQLIDSLKGICASYGLGNDGNEFKIITQVFLYKFMNDKFGYEVKKLDPKLKNSEKVKIKGWMKNRLNVDQIEVSFE